jgi:hypothetical protein
MKPFPVLSLLALLPLCALASEPSPYVGQETRVIKSLSPAEQADLIAGKGMGFAKAAELNGYPGPAHVLELAAQLQLTDAQRKQTEALFKDMEARAKALGAKLVEAERSLDEPPRITDETGGLNGRSQWIPAGRQGPDETVQNRLCRGTGLHPPAENTRPTG